MPKLAELLFPGKEENVTFGGSPHDEAAEKQCSSPIEDKVRRLVKSSVALSQYFNEEIPSIDIDRCDPIFLSFETIISEIENYEPGELLLECDLLIIGRGHDGSAFAADGSGTVIKITPGNVSGNGVMIRGKRENISRQNIMRSDGTIQAWKSIRDFLVESVAKR